MGSASEYGTADLIQPPLHDPTEKSDRRSVRHAAFLLRRAGLRDGALPAGTVPDPADTIGS